MEDASRQVLPAATPFPTVDAAKELLDALVALAPAGGTFLGITATYRSSMVISTPAEEAGPSWRIGVRLDLPRFGNMVFGRLAGWGCPGSRRRISFVVKGVADAVTVGPAEGPMHRAHLYTILNGSFQAANGLSTEIEHAVPFRAAELRVVYGTTYSSTDFEKIIAVVRSEITGAPVIR